MANRAEIFALPSADGVIVTLPLAPSHFPRLKPGVSALPLKSAVVLASCSMRAGRTPATCWMFCGPVAAGDAASRTNTCGSSGLTCFVSLEKKAAWVVKVKCCEPEAAAEAPLMSLPTQGRESARSDLTSCTSPEVTIEDAATYSLGECMKQKTRNGRFDS